MNAAIYIARKIQQTRQTKGSIIGPAINAATLAIALGMLLMLLSLSTGLGLKKAISDKIIGFTGHINIERYDINNSFAQQAITLDSITKNDIIALPYVKRMQPVGTKAGILAGGETFEGVVLKGVNGQYNWQFFATNLRQGKVPVFNDSIRNDSILISSQLVKILQLKLGDTVRMYFVQEPPKPPRIRKFIIGGIYATGLEDFDKTYLIGDLKHVQKLNGWQMDEVGGYEIELFSTENLEEKTWELRSLLPYDLDAGNVRTKNEQLFQWLDLFDFNIYIIIVIMVLVAIINMISALLILILDRINMIGLLKALGLSTRKLITLFLYQSLRIVLRGMLWGNAIGLILCVLQDKFGFVKLDPDTYYVNEAPILLHWPAIVLLNIGVAAICLLALLLPAMLVSRISPVKALRYE